MKLSNTSLNVPLTDTTKMSVNMDGAAFKIILEQLYSKPHEAVVRELCSNASDIHIKSGNPEPYFIQKPSLENPIFILRDFGTGLSESDVQLYLNTLLSSSKKSDNDGMGGYGVGAKTPFTITKNYLMNSYFEGNKYSYEWIYFNESPELRLTSITPTDEKAGLEFIIHLSDYDVPLILEGFKHLEYYRVAPRLFTDITDPATEIIDENNSYIGSISETIHAYSFPLVRSMSHNPSNILIRIGDIVYPLPKSVEARGSNYALHKFNRTRVKIVIDIPIGSLKLDLSRENVLDNTENSEYLKDILNLPSRAIKYRIADIFQNMFGYSFEALSSENSVQIPLTSALAVLKEFHDQTNLWSFSFLKGFRFSLLIDSVIFGENLLNCIIPDCHGNEFTHLLKDNQRSYFDASCTDWSREPLFREIFSNLDQAAFNIVSTCGQFTQTKVNNYLRRVDSSETTYVSFTHIDSEFYKGIFEGFLDNKKIYTPAEFNQKVRESLKPQVVVEPEAQRSARPSFLSGLRGIKHTPGFAGHFNLFEHYNSFRKINGSRVFKKEYIFGENETPSILLLKSSRDYLPLDIFKLDDIFITTEASYDRFRVQFEGLEGVTVFFQEDLHKIPLKSTPEFSLKLKQSMLIYRLSLMIESFANLYTKLQMERFIALFPFSVEESSLLVNYLGLSEITMLPRTYQNILYNNLYFIRESETQVDLQVRQAAGRNIYTPQVLIEYADSFDIKEVFKSFDNETIKTNLDLFLLMKDRQVLQEKLQELL